MSKSWSCMEFPQHIFFPSPPQSAHPSSSSIFSSYAFPHMSLSDHMPKYMKGFTSSISSLLIIHLLMQLVTHTTIVLLLTHQAKLPLLCVLLCHIQYLIWSPSGDSTHYTMLSAYSSDAYLKSPCLTPGLVLQGPLPSLCMRILYSKGNNR